MSSYIHINEPLDSINNRWNFWVPNTNHQIIIVSISCFHVFWKRHCLDRGQNRIHYLRWVGKCTAFESIRLILSRGKLNFCITHVAILKKIFLKTPQASARGSCLRCQNFIHLKPTRKPVLKKLSFPPVIFIVIHLFISPVCSLLYALFRFFLHTVP